jgi:hypothetical protein
MIFKYSTGRKIEVGDKVSLAGKLGCIGAIIQPWTTDARDYSCENTGGVFIADEDGDRPGWLLMVSTEDAEDLLFFGRECAPGSAPGSVPNNRHC